MFDRKSDFALNKKDPDAIVCKSSTGVHIRLTRLDFAMEKADHVYSNHTVPVDKLVEVSITVISPEDELMEVFSRQEREDLYRRLEAGLETRLTPTQRRRLWMYCVDGLSVEEIARKENVKHQNVSKRILAAKKTLKNFLEKWVQNHRVSGGK